MTERILPNVEQVISMITPDNIIGTGNNVSVYRDSMRFPEYSIRVNNGVKSLDELFDRMRKEGFIRQEDIFDGRNYAQTLAYLVPYPDDNGCSYVGISWFVAGYPLGINNNLSSGEALIMEQSKTAMVANMPSIAHDKVMDDLHFLSSCEYSIDVEIGHTDNMLCAYNDKELRIIDVQPFNRNTVGINPNHTKGSNTPHELVKGLLPCVYKYRKEHALDPTLIKCRTEIVSQVINAAERNHLNDFGSYVRRDTPETIARAWRVMLKEYGIPEKYIDGFVKQICSVKQENRYPLRRSSTPIIRVGGYSNEP